MRISDWSSDVCSSDLGRRSGNRGLRRWRAVRRAAPEHRVGTRGAYGDRMTSEQETNGSHAENYAAFKRTRKHPLLAEFVDLYAFPLDAFQLEACREVEDGKGVLVAALSGSGKTGRAAGRDRVWEYWWIARG